MNPSAPKSDRKRVVAVVQASTVHGSTQATLDKLSSMTAQAREKGAELVLFPEAFIGGYPRGMTFGTSVGHRSAEGRDHFRKYYEQAIELPGPESIFLSQVAQENQVHLVVGIIEREGGTLYCTVVFYAPDGRYLGKHRKLMPTGAERLIWGFGDGSTMPVFETELGKIGAVVCWENYMPLMRAAHYAKGIEIYLAPTADGRDTWLSTVRHIALEGRCFVLSCNQYCSQEDYPGDYPISPEAESTVLNSKGGSCIVGPAGEVLAGPHFDGEAILIAEIDLADISRGKYDFDVVGHYARPDVFSLQVNEGVLSPVVFHGAEK